MQPAVTNSTADVSATSPFKGAGILLWMIAFLSLAGIAVSGVSLQRHYAKSATTFCEFNEKFNCDIVNRSEYASIMGIPVAGIGVVGYGLLFALSTFQRRRAETPTRLVLAAGVGLAFALYLMFMINRAKDALKPPPAAKSAAAKPAPKPATSQPVETS